MTSGDHNLQDAELDDFLAGRDELSRQLAALAQPEAPKQVNDAVMASVAAQLAQEQAAKAAPAPQLTQVTQTAPRPAANMARWRAPAALAASLVGALLLTLEWQRGDYEQQARLAGAAQSAPPVSPSAAPPADAQPAKATATPTATSASAGTPTSAATTAPAGMPTSAGTQTSAERAASAGAPASAKGAASAGTAPPTEPAPIWQQLAAAPAQPLPSPAPAAPPARAAAMATPAHPEPGAAGLATAPAPAAPLALPLMAESADKGLPPTAAAPPAEYFYRSARAPIAAVASAPTVVSVTGARRTAEQQADAERAANWLRAIDDLLKAGLRQDAQQEWRKFRLAYPDYPVPEQLAKQIDAID